MTKNNTVKQAITLKSANYIRKGITSTGKEVMLYQDPVDVEEYTGVQLYTLAIQRGKDKGKLAHYVELEDYKPKQRASRKTEMLNKLDTMLATKAITRDVYETLKLTIK